MDEFGFIDRIRPVSYKQAALRKGIGDDAAVFRTQEDIVTATDTFVDQIHFSKMTTTPYHIGWRALAANVSDIAAMGADPKFYLVSIVIPESLSEDFLMELYKGMQEHAALFEIDLIGGDTVSGKELSLSVTIIGFVEKDKARYRSHAETGDIVFVSGTLGDSRAGLEILLNNRQEIENRDHFIKKHQLPLPQVKFGKLLQLVNRAALNDISDGIANELAEIATASNVAIVIDDTKIPVHPGLKRFSPEEQFQWKYFGGEDFELVGTLPPKDWPAVEAEAAKQNIQLTMIGKVTQNEKNQPLVQLHKSGRWEPLLKKGYAHLKQVNQ